MDNQEKKTFYVIPELCNGCENCALVCSMVLNKQAFSRESNIVVLHAEEAGYNQPGQADIGYDSVVVGCNAEPCGGEPKCTRYCPTGALIYGTMTEIAQRKREADEARLHRGEAHIRAPWAQRR